MRIWRSRSFISSFSVKTFRSASLFVAAVLCSSLTRAIHGAVNVTTHDSSSANAIGDEENELTMNDMIRLERGRQCRSGVLSELRE